MWPGDPHARVLGEVAQAAGGGVPVHPGAAAVEQDRPAGPVCGGAVDGLADCRGSGTRIDLHGEWRILVVTNTADDETRGTSH
jgi:hypothetical protein